MRSQCTERATHHPASPTSQHKTPRLGMVVLVLLISVHQPRTWSMLQASAIRAGLLSLLTVPGCCAHQTPVTTHIFQRSTRMLSEPPTGHVDGHRRAQPRPTGVEGMHRISQLTRTVTHLLYRMRSGQQCVTRTNPCTLQCRSFFIRLQHSYQRSLPEPLYSCTSSRT